MLGFSQLSKPIKWQDLLEKGKNGHSFEQVQRFMLVNIKWQDLLEKGKNGHSFEQVQRFMLAKKTFWGYGHFK